MSQRNVFALNNQIVLNSGSILNPSNLKAISSNSLKVRNDLLNITEYINGLLYYMFKTLPSGVNFPEDAANSGLSGNTILTNPNSIASFGEVFWLSSGEEIGRPKTITESLETLEAKLIEQQINISLVERVDLTQLASTVNSASLLVYKVKRNLFGSNYDVGSTELAHPVVDYLYHLYSSIFPEVDVEELNTGNENFPELAFSTDVTQVDIPGCGIFTNLSEELASIKTIINGNVCDPRFTLEFDENAFEPIEGGTTIEQSLIVLKNKALDLSDEVLQNATDISNIETQINTLSGIQAATEDVLGTILVGTEEEARRGVGIRAVGGEDLPLTLTSEKFVSSITNYANQTVMYYDNENSIVSALKYAFDGYISNSPVMRLRGSFESYTNIVRSSNPSNIFQGGLRRSYSVDTEGGDVTFRLPLIGNNLHGDSIRVSNETNSGRIIIEVTNQNVTIEGSQSLTLDEPYESVTLMMNGSGNKLLIVARNK